MDPLKNKSIAILHNHFPFIGGAERVAIESARILDAPVYTSYIDPKIEFPSDVDAVQLHQPKYTNRVFNHIITSGGAVADQVGTLNLILDLSNVSQLQEFDLVFESDYAAKHYTPSVGQTVVNYVHTMPQHYYNLYHYAVAGFNYPVLSFLLKFYVKICRVIDKEANDYVDQFIANSEVVRERVKTYYDREAEVIYPPVTGNWRHEADEGYFLTWSRLSPKKRVGMIAEAFTQLDEHLVIAGDGEERERIERITRDHENIELHGYVDDIESLVASSKAVVYAPMDESFGLVGAEALRAGKPLIGVDEGFTSYQVTTDTGITFSPTPKSLAETIEKFDADDYDYERIQELGKRYSYENFEDSLIRVLGNAVPREN